MSEDNKVESKSKSKRFTAGRILLYILVLPVFFFLGTAVSSLLGAADGQGLAAGAIVIFYGIATSIIALIFSLIISPLLNAKTVVRINVLLFILSLLIILWIFWRMRG